MHLNTVAGIIGFLVQIILIIVVSLVCDYDPAALPNLKNETEPESSFLISYPFFQDVHLMIFPAFGFLMTYLGRYRFTSIAITLFIAPLASQWAMLFYGLLHLKKNTALFSLDYIFIGDFSGASIMISMGAILGKASPLQMVLMAIIEVPFLIGNEYIGRNYLYVSDVAGAIYIHAFATYFGIFIACILNTKKMARSSNEATSYNSDILALIGTVILWVCWPSFNACVAVGTHAKHRAYLNSYLAMCSAAVGTLSMSALVGKGKFTMAHLQNSILSGGVAIGAVADMIIGPGPALLIGFLGSILSVVGFNYFTPALAKIGFHETCGINNLHGMPGLLSGIISVFVAGVATKETYGEKHLYEVFPGRKSRTAWQQAGYQLLGTVITFFAAALLGTLTGLFLKIKGMGVAEESGTTTPETYYRDDLNFFLPEMGEMEVRKRNYEEANEMMPIQSS